MKKLLSLSLLLCALCAQARILTIRNETPFAYWVWMASPPPLQSFAFSYVEARASVQVDIDAFEYRTIGEVSRPCSPLIGSGSIWFVDSDAGLQIVAPVKWDSLGQHARVTLSHNYSVRVKR